MNPLLKGIRFSNCSNISNYVFFWLFVDESGANKFWIRVYPGVLRAEEKSSASALPNARPDLLGDLLELLPAEEKAAIMARRITG